MLHHTDPFHHANIDQPDKVDPTELARVGFIAAATAYYLASAGDREAGALAGVVYAGGTRRLSDAIDESLMLLTGSAPADLAEAFGFAMGPFKVGDLAGNDIGWSVCKRRRAEKPGYKFSTLPDKLCEMGRFGQKTGAGWYEYPDGRKPLPSKVADELIAEHRRGLGITPRKITDAEIVDRLVYALVNEGARILDEKIAARASDIDIVYLNGYGFPQARGGPMLYADIVGLPNVVRSLKRFAAEPGAEAWWQPAPLLVKLAEDGKTFN